MALIECSECGGKLSNHAKACPHCGCPAPAAVKPAEPQATPPPIEASTPKTVPDQWYYQDGSQIHGPLSSHQLAELAAHGSLRPEHRVRKGTDGHWHMAGEVKGLHFAPAPQAHGIQAVTTAPPPLPAHHEPATHPIESPVSAIILSDGDTAAVEPAPPLPAHQEPLAQNHDAQSLAPPAVPTTAAPRRPWFHYAWICLGCTLLLTTANWGTLGNQGLLVSLALCGYGLLDKFVLSRTRPAIEHPMLKWIGVGAFAAWILCSVISQFKDPSIPSDPRLAVPLAVKPTFREQKALFGRNQYSLELIVYHKAGRSISGEYTIRAFGDVSGEGGESNEHGKNFVFKAVQNEAPGETEGVKCSFAIENATAKKGGVSLKDVEGTSQLTLAVQFRPAPGETRWKDSSWVFRFDNGHFVEYGTVEDFLRDHKSFK